MQKLYCFHLAGKHGVLVFVQKTGKLFTRIHLENVAYGVYSHYGTHLQRTHLYAVTAKAGFHGKAVAVYLSYGGTGACADISVALRIAFAVYAGLIAHFRIGTYRTVAAAKIEYAGTDHNGYHRTADLYSAAFFFKILHHAACGITAKGASAA